MTNLTYGTGPREIAHETLVAAHELRQAYYKDVTLVGDLETMAIRYRDAGPEEYADRDVDLRDLIDDFEVLRDLYRERYQRIEAMLLRFRDMR